MIHSLKHNIVNQLITEMNTKLLIFSILMLIIVSCSKSEDSYSDGDSNVVSDTKTISFKELVLLLSIQNPDSTFLVVERIDSLMLYVDDKFWAKINSVSLDTTTIDKDLNGNRFSSNDKVSYLVLSDQDSVVTKFVYAIQYAQFLNTLLELQPGEHACFLQSFMIKFNDGTYKKYYPNIYKIFNVEANTQSAFVGEFNIKIN